MTKFRVIEIKINKILTSMSFYFVIFLGILTSWLVKDCLTILVFHGKSFYGRSIYYQFIILAIFSIVFTTLFLGLFSIISTVTLRKGWKINIYPTQVLRNPIKHIYYALIILAVGFSLIFLINNILTTINTTNWAYSQPVKIPVELPVGLDFRVGSYRPAENLVNSGFKSISQDGAYASIYPPLVSLINIPYLLFDENKAYLLHIGFLLLANIGCLVIASLMVREFIFPNLGLEKSYTDLIILFLFFALLIYTLSSYSFIFSIERGQTDIFALFFALLAMWVLLKKPDQIWLQVILLSFATHLKIYPAVLFLLLLKKHGKKVILPTIAVNLAFLFILGPDLALGFIKTLTSGSGIGAGIGNPWPWIGNHSPYSFTYFLAFSRPNSRLIMYILWPLLTLILVELWVGGTCILFKNYSSQNAILFVMISIPLMDLLPTISMDYRLVILSSSVLLLLGLIIKRIIQCPHPFDYFQLGIVLILLLLIGRAYTMDGEHRYALAESASFFINNKFLWSLALESVMVWNVFNFRETAPDTSVMMGEVNEVTCTM